MVKSSKILPPFDEKTSNYNGTELNSVIRTCYLDKRVGNKGLFN